MNARIYLDGHASTPLAPEAKQAMFDAWDEPGNPGSPHFGGFRATNLISRARQSIADLVGCAASELTFTSGATEANNLAIIGSARMARASGDDRKQILISTIEHKSVVEAANSLRSEGFIVDEVPVDSQGLVDLRKLTTSISGETLLVSIGAANGEIGTVQPIEDIVAIARNAGALIHSDLAQLVGKLPIDLGHTDVDFASISAHKMYGPLGVGALYVSALSPKPFPLLHGGGQEAGLRSGTVAAPLVAGFGIAAELSVKQLADDALHGADLAQTFLETLTSQGVDWMINGTTKQRLPGSLSVQVLGIDADDLVDRLANTIAISTGSACQSGQLKSSHVLDAINISDTEKRSTIRLYFNRYNTKTEVIRAAAEISRSVHHMRLATGDVFQ